MRALLLILLLYACDGTDSPPDSGPLDSGAADSGADREVALSTTTLDLGAIVLTSSNRATFTITNPGNETLNVSLSAPAGLDAARFERSVNVPESDGIFRLEPRGVATV